MVRLALRSSNARSFARLSRSTPICCISSSRSICVQPATIFDGGAGQRSATALALRRFLPLGVLRSHGDGAGETARPVQVADDPQVELAKEGQARH